MPLRRLLRSGCSAAAMLAGMAAFTGSLGAGMIWAVQQAAEVGIDQQSMAQTAGNLLGAVSTVVSACVALWMYRQQQQGQDEAAHGPLARRSPALASMMDYKALREFQPTATGHALIDGQGRRIPVPQLGEHLGYPYADGADLINYCIRNGGYVEVRDRTLRFRADRVQPAAVTLAVQHIAALPPGGPVTVSAHLGGWMTTDFAAPSLAVNWIWEVIAAAGHPIPVERFRSVRLGCEALRGPMASLLGMWRESGRRLSGQLLSGCHASGLLDRAIIMAPKRTGLVFAHIGQGITVFGEAWRERMRGNLNDGAPDPGYAALACRGYRDAVRSGEPRYEHVDAVIRAEGVLRVRHERLLLPVRDDGDRSAVLCLSLRRPDIAIPLY